MIKNWIIESEYNRHRVKDNNVIKECDICYIVFLEGKVIIIFVSQTGTERRK